MSKWNVITEGTSEEEDKQFVIPTHLKSLFRNNFQAEKTDDIEHNLLVDKAIETVKSGAQKSNYSELFHLLLWSEELFSRINLSKYNLTAVSLWKNVQQLSDEAHAKEARAGCSSYWLNVPGLQEKKPSLIKGDEIIIIPHQTEEKFHAEILQVQERHIIVGKFSRGRTFHKEHSDKNKYDVRFVLSRHMFVKLHRAVENFECFSSWLFPAPHDTPLIDVKLLEFTEKIRGNAEQRRAVEQIVRGSAGAAPYLVFGPPGTGKTLTIAEAVAQLVMLNPEKRILVCAESNMASDNVAVKILECLKERGAVSKNILRRVNSQSRNWESLPEELVPYSNKQLDIVEQENADLLKLVTDLSKYNVIVCTLSISSSFLRNNSEHALRFSHVVIDEASQASEPKSLLPLDLLRSDGCLVLAGDVCQLEPVCLSRSAAEHGLGKSLMERLIEERMDMYCVEKVDHRYMTLLRNNFRSDRDIIALPNELFYYNSLRACAEEDELSCVDLMKLQDKSSSKSISFHNVAGQEERDERSPSCYNLQELQAVLRYLQILLNDIELEPRQVAVITPYAGQLKKLKSQLEEWGMTDVETGTVDSFQGREKRVIIISTVRTDHLGFLTHKRRFNVAVTRAKAKLIVIGNEECLSRDRAWFKYMQRCKELKTFNKEVLLPVITDCQLKFSRRDRTPLQTYSSEEQLFIPVFETSEYFTAEMMKEFSHMYESGLNNWQRAMMRLNLGSSSEQGSDTTTAATVQECVFENSSDDMAASTDDKKSEKTFNNVESSARNNTESHQMSAADIPSSRQSNGEHQNTENDRTDALKAQSIDVVKCSNEICEQSDVRLEDAGGERTPPRDDVQDETRRTSSATDDLTLQAKRVSNRTSDSNVWLQSAGRNLANCLHKHTEVSAARERTKQMNYCGHSAEPTPSVRRARPLQLSQTAICERKMNVLVDGVE